MDDIKTWTGLSVEEPLRMTEEKVNGESTSLVWPTLGSRTAKEQDRTEEMGFIQCFDRPTVDENLHLARKNLHHCPRAQTFTVGGTWSSRKVCLEQRFCLDCVHRPVEKSTMLNFIYHIR